MQFRREAIEFTMPDLPLRAVIKSSDDEHITADAHLHTEIELIRVLEGSMTFQFNNQSITLKAGQLIFINSRVVHATALCEPMTTRIFVLQFNPALLYSQPLFSKHHLLLSFINHDDTLFTLLSTQENAYHAEIAMLSDRINDEFNHKEVGFELSIKSYLYRILALLHRSDILHLFAPLQNSEKYTLFCKLEPIFDYTQTHYMEDITADNIMQILHFNYSYFCRLFKKATGKSYIDYLNYVRITMAEELIRKTDLPISVLFEKTGFSSLSYFNKVFKSIKGISPSEYRKITKSTLTTAEPPTHSTSAVIT